MTRALLKCQKEAARDKVKVDVKRGWNASKNRCLRRISSKCGRFVTIDSDSNREHGPVINFHACRRKAFAHPSGRRLVADNARHQFRLSRPKFPPITPSGRRRRNPRVVRVPRHLSGIVGILSIARFLAIVRVSAVRNWATALRTVGDRPKGRSHFPAGGESRPLSPETSRDCAGTGRPSR
jgi:hypothetical protein